ncbi:hypothetical protein [Paenibacillus larvae]|uniref:Nucleotide pyrophosphohydrolase n=1 Tax=Paenibacillus larvae subsp. larvae DSM 25430 TaxID=697284 RepID=V9W626_9BACL|nr:hypothetical protein [Paenibacillus larvae]AHD06471.1 hypothetical protein ERIC2_c26840 [Paenibacillus larvae subsp. larvae DSM 25430]AVG13018.1 hypothetical protein ERICII_02664 [Paenibacillus larvae subsp. larvae DSM 25430]MDR5568987.1 hypothetical protein [Paenibacillus larvae]MDR5596736.1 hypothetical protein [Paenibacillus larvae]
MKEEIKLRPEVQWFAEQMELKLRENDHKGGWSDENLEHLLWRLGEEYAELRTAIELETDIMREAVDVANFAMMIADRVIERRRRSEAHSRKHHRKMGYFE